MCKHRNRQCRIYYVFYDKETKTKIDCHQEHESSTSFHIALDREKGLDHAHFGYHRHIHYADTFLKHIEDGWGK